MPLSVPSTVLLNLISLSRVTEHPWSNQQGGLCLWTGTGLHIANEDRTFTAGKEPHVLHLSYQGRTKGSEFHMAAREDLCFRMENLHKTNKERFGATAASKDCPRNQLM